MSKLKLQKAENTTEGNKSVNKFAAEVSREVIVKKQKRVSDNHPGKESCEEGIEVRYWRDKSYSSLFAYVEIE
ncbi:hypothetical protein H5410_044350 [Solanum commersonii]|uniref:Uncharacterized protein n=1 Tax=Solanum commersonii TaxID=4109 RepID=A0A9J5X9M5_SOLCO|nr:hypothetical protein H5410_044350 [Solanum commersonii]